MATLVWFRQDLRLADNPTLAAAIERGEPVVPVYILDDAGEGHWPAGGATRWWLHHSLAALEAELHSRGSRLILARGETQQILLRLVKQTKATAVHWNRRYEPAAIKTERKLAQELGVPTASFNASLLFEPNTVRNKSGLPFQVFTPFWKHCLTLPVEKPVVIPSGKIRAPVRWPASLSLEKLKLLPTIPWDAGLRQAWKPGETSAAKRLARFCRENVADYPSTRNQPDRDGTSALSPHLHFGEIGPRQIWEHIRRQAKSSGVFPPSRGAQVYLTEIGWREFAHHQLFHFPHTPESPLRKQYRAFPWRTDAKQLRAWQRGRTGYPIVDAGMRQLWATGWMHNRVRMIVASFFVKHLRLTWQKGATWFWDTLVDADLANNTLNWQWSAGCGADAAPYFRIFNPILQGEKFDPEGTYVRQWVPELAGVSAKFIHRPWEIPVGSSKNTPGAEPNRYPPPVVDHARARSEALDAFRSLRR